MFLKSDARVQGTYMLMYEAVTCSCKGWLGERLVLSEASVWFDGG